MTGSGATQVALGVAAHMGWAAVAVVARRGGAIRVIRTERMATAKAGDLEAMEPYHLAAGFDGPKRVPPPDDPAAAVARGIARQRRGALASFRKLCRELRRAGYEPNRAAILSGRGQLAASLDKVLASHAQIHIAEGIAARASIADALRQLGLAVDEVDQRSLYDDAARVIGKSRNEIDSALKTTRPENMGPWRQDQKLAALAAWAVALKHTGAR